MPGKIFLIMLMRVGFNDLFNINCWERQRPLVTDTKNLKSTLVCPSGTCLPVRPFPPHREKPIYGTMPGPLLKPEDQPCGCSGPSVAGNLPIGLRNLWASSVVVAFWSPPILQQLQHLVLIEQWRCLDESTSALCVCWRNSFIKTSMLVNGS